MADAEKYDTAFLGIMQNEGTIVNFLDKVFSFLYRRTDFYQLLNEQKTMGFPPGIAAKLAYSAFKTYQEKADEDRKKLEARKERLKAQAEANVPPVAQIEEVSTEEPEAAAAPPTSPPQPTTLAASDRTDDAPVSQAAQPQQTSPAQVEKKEGEKSSQNEEVKDSGDRNDPDDDPELTKLQREFQANPDSYNGAIRENYVWGQEITEVNARILIPQHIQKGKDCRISIQKKHLKVEVRKAESPNDWQLLVDEDLVWEVNPGESFWSIVNDCPRPDQPKQYNIHINLEKIEERWWDALLVGEEKISVRKIDPSRPMTDLDDEAQAKLEEMMWNERQKKLGLPQSGAMKMESMLKQAWDAEGSPFKGQPFDMSKVNISNDGQNISFNQ